MILLKLLVPFLLLFVFACKKDGNRLTVCGVKDPSINLPWLKHTIDSLNERKVPGEVSFIHYEGQDYLNIQPIYMACVFCSVYRCDGRRLTHPEDSALYTKLLEVHHDGRLKVITRFGKWD